MNMDAQVKRSMRTIMAELEFLADSNYISASDLSQITTILNKVPTAEQPPQTQARAPFVPTPIPTTTPTYSPPTANTITSNLNSPPLKSRSPVPVEETPQQIPPPPPPYTLPTGPRPGCHGRALHDFNYGVTKRPGRLSFHADDTVVFLEEIDANWWNGQVVDSKTGAMSTGMFPLNYVQVVSWPEESKEGKGAAMPAPPPPLPARRVDSASGSGMGTEYIYSGGAGPAEEGKEKSKLQSGGEKFGRKLGNAAIFGAGATIGSKIVNTIF